MCSQEQTFRFYVKTVYPGFQTDLQSPFCSASGMKGKSCLIETIFERRAAGELKNVGANIRLMEQRQKFMEENCMGRGRSAGTSYGAALVLAGLAAKE